MPTRQSEIPTGGATSTIDTGWLRVPDTPITPSSRDDGARPESVIAPL